MGGTRLRWGIVVLVALAITPACAAPSGSTPDAATPSASPTEDADFAETFDIGDGRRMFLECVGTGSPTVVFISGQRGSAGDWSITADGVDSPPVFSLVSEHTRVCAYDRPGTPVGDSPSRSDPIEQPATSGGMVEDLHALLAAADVEQPVVLTGHSAGGLAARLYAMTYPEAVAGMVLVDASSEGLQDFLTAEQWEIQKPLLRGAIDDAIAEYPPLEWLDAETSFAQVRAAPPLRQMPLVVLSSDELIGPTIPGLKEAGVIGPEIPDDFGYITDGIHVKSQERLSKLVEGTVFVTETHSGHNIHYQQPALVADSVIQVVDLVRAGADRAQ